VHSSSDTEILIVIYSLRWFVFLFSNLLTKQNSINILKTTRNKTYKCQMFQIAVLPIYISSGECDKVLRANKYRSS